eukprot:6459026-Amphidinium_carterae.1
MPAEPHKPTPRDISVWFCQTVLKKLSHLNRHTSPEKCRHNRGCLDAPLRQTFTHNTQTIITTDLFQQQQCVRRESSRLVSKDNLPQHLMVSNFSQNALKAEV